jgi:hypothetical protein
MSIVEVFDELTQLGLKTIALRPQSKIPVCKDWHQWNHDLNRHILHRNPTCNLGLLLGDIIDVEGDSEEANALTAKLIGDYPHPSYTSTKSVHHLFQNPDPTLTIFKKYDVEFRANRHQSVLPPSEVDKNVYRWLTQITLPPPMPAALLRFYHDHSPRKKKILKPGHTRVRCSICSSYSRLHRKRFELELAAMKSLGLRWACRDCRTVDLRPLCRSLRRSPDFQATSL